MFDILDIVGNSMINLLRTVKILLMGHDLSARREAYSKTRVNLSFSKKNRAKTVNLSLQYRLKTWKFSRSWMKKWTSSLGSSCEI